ncbi:hypothetical protein M407DRAFT_12576 [Tulasnella calospora MUT 4182]|uniref:Uncharacterized protein n=1 Tax=Tulasnella calospora MUT 4182 TaxID=1051891 RepID=A0A0C3K6E8_9AGAM|nr:hypothetical protein M407DRAFT_12576 [Tulasnella calospora MUT 4182]
MFSAANRPATCANFSQRGLQPEWALPVRTLSALSQSQELTNSARGERTFTTVEAVWALLVDVCRRYGLRHFAITSATHIALSAFSPTYQTGHTSPPILMTIATHDLPWATEPQGQGLIQTHPLCRCSWTGCGAAWVHSASSGTIPEHAGLTGILGDATFGWPRKALEHAERGNYLSGRRSTREPECRNRWIKKSGARIFGNEMVRGLSQGIKRRFEDRDSGGEDVAVYQEVVQDGPITAAGQRRWFDILTRKRYLELGHHVMEVDGSLCAAIDAAQGNMDTMGAFPVTPTRTRRTRRIALRVESSRASSRRFSGAIRITKSLPKKKGDIRAKSVTFQKQDDGDDSMDLDGNAEDAGETEEEERGSNGGHFYNTR